MKEFRRFYPDMNDFVASTSAARVNGYLGGYGTLESLNNEIESYGLSPEGIKKLKGITRGAKRCNPIWL